ncbi:MAG: polysaccharide biosynthesis/export family protein [Akkermansiaceae bacterium]
MSIFGFFSRAMILFTFGLSLGCSWMSQPGPQKSDIVGADDDGKQPPFAIVEVRSKFDLPKGSRTYGQGQIPPKILGESYSDKVRTRDSLTFVITDVNEQSPFFTGGEKFPFGPLEVPANGIVRLPYVGELNVMGKTVADISRDLNDKLKPISNTAQSSVAISGRIARTANVIGEVINPGPVSLEKENFTTLDLLAASGGPAKAEHLFKYIYRRNGVDYHFDYQGFRKKAFSVEEGDLLSVTTDTSNRFYVMGAINKPVTVPFPVPSPTLADALGAAVGLDERRSDATGVFVFRKGNPDTVYTLNMKEPAVMFLTQRFDMKGEDIVYITEAPLTRWNRLINQLLPFSQSLFNIQRTTNQF